VRLSFARWLALGLEFELAADILRIAITATWNVSSSWRPSQLCGPPCNHFLAKEIEKESSSSQRSASGGRSAPTKAMGTACGSSRAAMPPGIGGAGE
jgi:hypothetical protein